MNRILVITGVHLDRAWTDLGGAFGIPLRRWSREALALGVQEARRLDVDSLVVLGDLMDRATVVPDTVHYAAAVLGSFPGNVLILPGTTDWLGDDGPYELANWAKNTNVWTSAGFEPIPTEPTLWGSAWTSPSSRTPRIPMRALDEQGRTFLRAGLSEADLGAFAPGDRAVTTGGEGSDRMLAVPDLVHRPGDAGGWALLVDRGRADIGGERIHILGQPGASVQLDVTELKSPEAFRIALRAAVDGVGPVQLRLIGQLGPRVLLPGFGGPDLPANAVLDAQSVRYAVEVPERSDQSTLAEFLRAMALARGDERERHQTTALGLTALSTSAAGA
jgi:hypothetical protein